MAHEGHHAYVSDYNDSGYDEDLDTKSSGRLNSTYYAPPPVPLPEPSFSQGPPYSRHLVGPSYLDASSATQTPRSGRSRAPSNAASTISQPQPVRPPGSVPGNMSEQVESTNQVTPALVAQITEAVIENLKLNGIMTADSTTLSSNTPSVVGSTTPSFSAKYDAPPPSDRGPQAIPPRNVVTPPYYDSAQYDGGNDRRVYQEGDTRVYAEGDDDDVGSPKHTATRPPEQARPRPAAPQQESDGNTTTLEKIWQPLFDSNNRGTPRLGQFLRGLALHIIADFEPRNSLVVTPKKMLEFYDMLQVPDEYYPWQDIFDGTMEHANLSYTYRDLQCEHVFVQDQPHKRPTIPSLTPAGFETWMTHIIRAYPDHEYKRFADAVRELPISNADDPKERFPKELSRRLFPTGANVKMQIELEESILEDEKIKLPRRASMAQQRSSFSTTTSSQGYSSGSQRSRRPTNSSSVRPPMPSSSNSGNPLPSSLPATTLPDSCRNRSPERKEPSIAIERERKPYSAQPGVGKTSPSAPPTFFPVPSSSTTSASSTAPSTPRKESLPPLHLQRPDLQPRQMSDVPEESPSPTRYSPSRSPTRTNSSRPHRTSSIRHGTNQGPNMSSSGLASAVPSSRQRRSSSLASKQPPMLSREGSVDRSRQPAGLSREGSVDRSFPPSAYSAGTGYDGSFARGGDRDRYASDRDSEEEWLRNANNGRRFSKSSGTSSDEPPKVERVRRYVVPEPLERDWYAKEREREKDRGRDPPSGGQMV